jgi:CcmD family protein
MGEWGWVALGYAITAAAVAGYLLLLRRRIRAARRRLEELR